MAICASYDGAGHVVVVTPPPTDLSTCVLLIPSGTEGITNPFALSAEDGAVIAGAIAVVWGVGFVFRALVRSLLLGESNETD